jgi:hypothetical protein
VGNLSHLSDIEKSLLIAESKEANSAFGTAR